MTKKMQQQFNELKELADKVSGTKYNKVSEFTGSMSYVDAKYLLQWITKTDNLIANVCGKDSSYFDSFTKAKKPQGLETNLDIFNRLEAIFIAIKEDYEKGYITSYKALIQAELFENELEQAKELLSSGYITASAVIAGTVLETSLRELCKNKSIPNGKLDKMNADLAKQGVYNLIQQKAITAIAGIRNSAAHGKVNDFDKDDVKNMISSIESFLIKHLN
ncbi:DUF4145 domain-containing protein [Proteus vulgaris]|uniref:DUF4145 domain-containing protein n=1 Tax=Proteus vulgaris TaxID=585 RepID=UPI000C9FD680|nr:DUF4145 domain-containing protein [Proteus vulgaris]UBH63109.1 DUF4145 domain-containing protein [Proteus vulgaris]VTP71084.1 Uncharacterised protein [Proteus vulgaris]